MLDFYKIAQMFFVPKAIDGKVFIDAGKLKPIACKLPDIKANITIPNLVLRFDLNHHIVGRGKNQPVIRDISIGNGYNSKPHAVYIEYDQVLAHEELKAIIISQFSKNPNCLAQIEKELSSDLATVSIQVINPPAKVPVAAPMVTPVATPEESIGAIDAIVAATMLYYRDQPLPILQIKEEERFTIDGHAFEIEIRGAYAVDQIYFKAENISTMFEMPSLTHTLLSIDSYVEQKHYIIANSCPLAASSHCDEAGFTQETPEKLDNHRTFLTWEGLLKVLFSSKSGNAMRHKMVTWVVETMYTHQYGSIDERSQLASKLTSSFRAVLNSKSGVYLIRIGKVKALRESMAIDQEAYPNDNDYVYKFGRSEDMLKRFSQHSAKTGYGGYSTSIIPEIFAFLPEKKVVLAEKAIDQFVTTHKLKLPFTDANGKGHSELVILSKIELDDLKRFYQSLLDTYGNKDDQQMGQMLTDMQRTHTHEMEMLRKNLDTLSRIHEKDEALLAEKNIRIAEKDFTIEAKDATIEALKQARIQDAQIHALTVELLQLKLATKA